MIASGFTHDPMTSMGGSGQIAKLLDAATSREADANAKQPELTLDADAFAAARRAPFREVAALVGMLEQGRIRCPNCNALETAVDGGYLMCGVCAKKHDVLAFVRRARNLRGDTAELDAVKVLVGAFGAAKLEAAVDAWSPRLVSPPAEWFTAPPPRREWLLRDSRTKTCDGVLPLGKVGLLVAAGGGGKTMALIQLMITVAVGGKWLGTLDVATPGPVLAILAEEDQEEVQRRIYNAARALSTVTPEPDAIVTMPLAGVPSAMVCRDAHGNSTDAPFLIWLRALLAKKAEAGWRPRLVIVDPLSRFAGADAEKDNAQATRFVEALESLAVQTGATILVAHHSNQNARQEGTKASASLARGVTGLTDGVRWAAHLSAEGVPGLDTETKIRLGEVVTLSFVKSNYSRKADAINLRRDPANGGALLPLDEVDVDFIAQARKASDPRATREADRAQSSAAAKARAELDRRAKEEAHEAKERARRTAEDVALRECVETTPGLNEDSLIAAMRARLGRCSDSAVKTAVARARQAGWLEVRVGAKNAKGHHVKEKPEEWLNKTGWLLPAEAPPPFSGDAP